jgi:glutamyl/glutaminyl-tRNA synthetase
LSNSVESFFVEDVVYDQEALVKMQSKFDIKTRLNEFISALESVDVSNEKSVESLVHNLATTHGVNSGEYIHSVRLAVAGRTVGPSFFGLLRVLGKKIALNRLKNFLIVNGL